MKTRRRYRLWGTMYAVALILFTAYVLLDTFVIPRSYAAVQDGTIQAETSGEDEEITVSTSGASRAENSADDPETSDASDTGKSSSAAETVTATDTSYQNSGVSITMTTTRYEDTTVYVADITLSSAEALKTALAKDTYGKNLTEKTSVMAEEHSAVLAVNGDYYGAQNRGYVIRNGTLYRDTAASSDQEDLVIGSDGSFSIIKEGDVTAQELLDEGAWQVFSFGPALVEDGSISVGTDTEVDKAKTSNPRTAIGEIAQLHYVMVVADGRTEESAGLSLYEFAEFLQNLGVSTAYNLDGGGSSTMYFNGQVINNPTSGGDTISERKVSDIVYVGV
ncbi:MAG TPA: phosphodiester glycosidase family protein [Oscillospiraceae bacterium]|nr:phosphodiester glycosidase family protein [Oscillospiraceae bacterium]HRW57167.1 phosphodiester glycosidase family protein [Oscillospiraceae bacterium]